MHTNDESVKLPQSLSRWVYRSLLKRNLFIFTSEGFYAAFLLTLVDLDSYSLCFQKRLLNIGYSTINQFIVVSDVSEIINFNLVNIIDHTDNFYW